jgi:hypothetical protein
MILELPNWIISRFAWHLKTHGSNAVIGLSEPESLSCQWLRYREIAAATSVFSGTPRFPSTISHHPTLTLPAKYHVAIAVADINPQKWLIISDIGQE